VSELSNPDHDVPRHARPGADGPQPPQWPSGWPTGAPTANGPGDLDGPAATAVALDTGTMAGPQTSVIDYNGATGPHLGSGPLVGLEARNVSAWFGDHKVLERVSLNMQPGRVTALIGPSGCGKSTFLRILNRMHEMVRGASLGGEVLLAGEDIYDPGTRASIVRRRIGMVFQKPNPFPAMSIYDNVISGLKLAGIKVKNKDQLVELSLRRAGLWGEVQRRLQMPGGALSGGQQQRLCIARSLAVSPDVLLMDEPCSALDPTSTRRIEETIAELQNQVTIVIVTHNMQQAQRVSSDCAFFLASEGTPGHIVESGETEQLFDNPNDPRTADYVHGRFG
jgi:phosphate transport system ATP-binding protein